MLVQKAYNLYKRTGEFVGEVKEFTNEGAIKWGAFWYNVPERDLASVLQSQDTGNVVKAVALA